MGMVQIIGGNGYVVMGCYRTIAAATCATDESYSSSVVLLSVDCSGETHVFDESGRRGEVQVLVATASRCVIDTADVRVQPNTIATKHLNTPQQLADTVTSRSETEGCATDQLCGMSYNVIPTIHTRSIYVAVPKFPERCGRLYTQDFVSY